MTHNRISLESFGDDNAAWAEQLIAYDAALSRGETPSESDADLPQGDQRRLANGRLAIDALHEAFNDRQQVDEPSIARTLGEFRIIREIGRGGMGVVYEAEQTSLGRGVALKVLPFAAVLDKQQLARFKNEALAAATLSHPHIVAVHAVGCEEGVHFLAMQLIEGQSMDAAIKELRAQKANDAEQSPDATTEPLASARMTARRQSTRGEAHNDVRCHSSSTSRLVESKRSPRDREYFLAVADLAANVADALHYAHSQGVLHRDIKPGNLFLDADGDVYIGDFGLARMENMAGTTMTGEIVGTLRYMSCEQALGAGPVDQRADVYSLGATLYELLTLHPPFQGVDRQQLLQHIAEKEPTPPSTLNKSLPRDLETIVLKAMAKDRDDRYSNAAELAADLRRYRQNLPIKARPVSTLRKLTKWSARHQELVLTLMVSLGLLAASLGVASGLLNTAYHKERLQRTAAEEQRRKADASARTLAEHLYAADMHFGVDAWQHQQFQVLDSILSRYDDSRTQNTSRGFVWNFLRARTPQPTATIKAHAGPVVDAVFARTDQLLVTGGEDGAVRFFDLAENCQALTRFDYFHQAEVTDVDVSGDGNWIASTSSDGVLAMRSATRATTEAKRIQLGGQSLTAAACSPGEDLIAVGDEQGTLNLVDSRDGELIRTWPAHPGDVVRSIVFSEDGRRLASGGDDQRACLWDVSTGDKLKEFSLTGEPGNLSRVFGVAFAGDGQRLAAISRDGRLYREWEIESGQMTGEHWLPSEVLEGLALSGNDQHAVCVCKDGTIRVIDRTYGWGLMDFPCEVGRPMRAQFSRDGSRLAIAGSTGEVNVYGASDVLLRPQILSLPEIHSDCDFSRDGRFFVAASTRGQIRCWDAAAGEFLFEKQLELPSPESSDGYYCPVDVAGHRAAVGSDQIGHVEVWDLSRCERVSVIPHAAMQLAISPDGISVTTAGRNQICIWNASTGTLNHAFDIEKLRVRDASYSPDGRLVAVHVRNRGIRVLQTANPEISFDLEIGPAIGRYEFSPDSEQLVVARSRHDCIIIDLKTRRQTGALIGHTDDLIDLAFSRDGLTLATVSKDRTLRFWDMRTLKSQGAIEIRQPRAVAFGPDDESLVCLTGGEHENHSSLVVFSAAPENPLRFQPTPVETPK